jgi:hypothetical protein
MPQLPELEALARRRAQLAARADAYRAVLVLEARSIEARTATARRVIELARTVLPLLALVAFARGGKSAAGKSPLGRIAPWIARFKLATGVRTLVRSVRSRDDR